jgi:hypothetical protein
MTQFETAVLQAKAGELKTPTVSTSNGNVDYFWYQLSVHHYNLKLMSKGILSRNVKLKDLKAYYGLKGRSAGDCLNQYEMLIEGYKEKYLNK